jgi:hypothetical protein
VRSVAASVNVPWQSEQEISTAFSMLPCSTPSPMTSLCVWQSMQCMPFWWWTSGGVIAGSLT